MLPAHLCMSMSLPKAAYPVTAVMRYTTLMSPVVIDTAAANRLRCFMVLIHLIQFCWPPKSGSTGATVSCKGSTTAPHLSKLFEGVNLRCEQSTQGTRAPHQVGIVSLEAAE